MTRVGKFEKVSYEQFREAMQKRQDHVNEAEFWSYNQDSEIFHIYENLHCPTRSTRGSAGYDFKSPFDFELKPGETIRIPSGIRVKIDEGWFLGIFPRSSLGFKYRCQIDNTVGIIDSDYYNSDNEGHIAIKITNDSKDGKTIVVKSGESLVQGIFIPYGITYGDEATGIRNGGIGSTNTAS